MLQIQTPIAKGLPQSVILLIKSKLFIIAVTFAFLGGTRPSLAEESGGHGGGGGEHEAPKTEGGEAGNEGEGKDKGSFIKKDDYLELNSSIEQINAKIKIKRENLKKLLVDKDHAKDPEEFKRLVKEIESEYREINELAENVAKKKAIVRFRFPERSFVKDAEKSKVQHLEELGAEALIEKEMNFLLNVVESQYKTPIRPKALREKVSREPANAHGATKELELQQNPEDFSRSLIIKK